MVQDFRFAARQLLKYPGFSLAVILTLTLGIGVNTAVFSMLDGFLLRTLPYPQPERIAAVVLHEEGIRPVAVQRYPMSRTTLPVLPGN